MSNTVWYHRVGISIQECTYVRQIRHIFTLPEKLEVSAYIEIIFFIQ